jgi:hypothetical protein
MTGQSPIAITIALFIPEEHCNCQLCLSLLVLVVDRHRELGELLTAWRELRK